MKNLFLYFILICLLLSAEGKANEFDTSRLNFQEIINIGKMQSHDNKFTLYFKTREKAVLAKGQEINYIRDYPQDLYIFYNDTGSISPIITYDWFPKKVKELGTDYDLPIFPEDFAYYLLGDNETLLMISGIKSIGSNYKFNLKNHELVRLDKNNKYNLFVFSLLKDCGYKNLKETYKCSFYKPLISENLIN